MALSTYAELQSAITNLLHRDDLTAAVPDFIALAEAALNRSLRTRQMEGRVTTTSSERYLTLPSDFQELRNIKVYSTRHIPLTQISVEQIDGFYSSADTGIPNAYAIVGSEIYIAPPPNGEYTYEINYFAKIPALSTDGVNWLLTAHPDAYLYGALLHTAPYLKDDGRLATWGTLYGSALKAIEIADAKARWGGNVLQVRTDSPIV